MAIPTREDVQSQITKKVWKDAAFKKQLLSAPEATLEKELGLKLPKGIKVHIHEESASQVHLVIPRNPEEMALPDELLEKVAGGKDHGSSPPQCANRNKHTDFDSGCFGTW